MASARIVQCIRGLNCFYGDSSAAIVADRTLLTAAEQERLDQEVGGVSGRMLLAEAGISLVDVATLQ
jgi:hypothetical protein